jgi:hypothetical protein
MSPHEDWYHYPDGEPAENERIVIAETTDA